ncbi:MAG TPA: glycosyltransferase family A protein, partial [Gemmatimonadaceae bacterium]|nr:glycosyltransferase family A protein [Gemmatimonadaceae bacterium]
RCLRSIQAQDLREIEVIVSDNASTDGSAELCERFAASDPRIIVHRQPANIGAAANFNFVRHRARAESFLWIGCDDYYESPRLLSALYARSARGAAMVFPETRLLDTMSGAPVMRTKTETYGRLRAARTPFELARALATSDMFSPAVYGMYNLRVLRERGVDLAGDQGLRCFNDGIMLHSVLATGLCEFEGDVVFVYTLRKGSERSAQRAPLLLEDFWRYCAQIPGIYARSVFSQREQLSLLGELLPSQAKYAAILAGSVVKQRLRAALRA